jgi:hypothetical protein
MLSSSLKTYLHRYAEQTTTNIAIYFLRKRYEDTNLTASKEEQKKDNLLRKRYEYTNLTASKEEY